MATPALKAARARSKARMKFQPLTEPNPEIGDLDRSKWLDEVCAGFVQPSSANRKYYRVVLESLWPDEHGIPGPLVSEREIRSAVDRYRRTNTKGNESYHSYRDPFRRVRELMGEEGVIGIGKQGHNYQLVNLALGAKRKPRTGLNDGDWAKVLEQHHGKCPVCGRSEPQVRFDQDHKVPRLRGGGDELDNWQPLCIECNRFKMMMCRGCTDDCKQCGWAFPEKFAPLRLSSGNIVGIREMAHAAGRDPHVIANELLAAQLKAIRG
jgi:5-methylcytosine-specific restriction endonuclease McrA